jgi:hypothetical protein
MARPSTPAAPIRSATRQPSVSLQRVQSGEMSLDEYLNERTERALHHVRGKVDDDMLETIRVTLREQLRSDPVLIELVRKATGQSPEPLPADPV